MTFHPLALPWRGEGRACRARGRSALAISRPPVVEVMVAPRADAASSLEVVLASGVRVAVPIGFDEATPGRLLTVLEER